MTQSEQTAGLVRSIEPLTQGKKLSRGTLRRMEVALSSGVDEATVARGVVVAAQVADEEGRHKIGSFGGQKRVFSKLTERARMSEVRERQKTSREKLRRRRGW